MLMASTSIILLLVVTMVRLAILGLVVYAVMQGIKALKEQAGEDPLRREGYRDGTWVLLDYGCVCVHVFSEEAREFYSLERLWHDGKPVDLSGVLTAD